MLLCLLEMCAILPLLLAATGIVGWEQRQMLCRKAALPEVGSNLFRAAVILYFHRRDSVSHMIKYLLKQSAGRVLAFGFLFAIMLGSFILMLPVSLREDVELHYIDALYTATSAVCVTGLTSVDVAAVFSPFGYAVIAVLIQIGGLGIAIVGAGVFLAMGKRVNLRERMMIRYAMNLDSDSGTIRFVKHLLLITVIFESAGAIVCFFIFLQDYPPLQALGISVFHSIASFNNAGFDLFGNFESLASYSGNVPLLVTTAVLIIGGGIGFLVVGDIVAKRGKFSKFRLHTKVVLLMTAVLLVGGTLLFKAVTDLSWLDSAFYSVAARTAGFATAPVGSFSNAGILILVALMFVGGSPGSTAGGIKTTTLFILLQGIRTFATNKRAAAFHYSLPRNMFEKAAVVTILAAAVVLLGTFLMAVLEPEIPLRDLLVEVTSAFGTVGYTTGISPQLGTPSKVLTILIMFIGRLGPLTIATLWYFGPITSARYPEGRLSIG